MDHLFNVTKQKIKKHITQSWKKHKCFKLTFFVVHAFCFNIVPVSLPRLNILLSYS